MSKKCVAIIIFLLLVIAGGLYKFMFQGSVSEDADGRTAIHLSAGERDFVLAEMRSFLESVQQITQGIASDDIKLVVTAARHSGMAEQGDVPGSLRGKLPIGFKKLGFDTHSKFDRLAMDSEDLEDGAHALSQLSTLIQNCVACHAAFRIKVADE